jgi:hypothetical protein
MFTGQMKTKNLIILITLLFLVSSITSAQTDSLKITKIKNQTVEIGKFYEVLFPNLPSTKGKLVGINQFTFLMLVDNEFEEIAFVDIIRLIEMDADNVIYTAPKKKDSKPIYSLSAGYLQRETSNNSSYYYYSGTTSKYNGFDVLGDVLMKTSENFGFRIDLNYVHILGKSGVTNYTFYNSYDSITHRSETDHKAMNIFLLKTGICFGSMNKELPFNFYIFLGLGFGWLLKASDINYEYSTKNNVTTVAQSSMFSNDGFMIGIHGQIRLSYKIYNKYRLFIEPTYQFWGNKIDQLYGINGGISFNL